jgi:hypothetical protein
MGLHFWLTKAKDFLGKFTCLCPYKPGLWKAGPPYVTRPASCSESHHAKTLAPNLKCKTKLNYYEKH